MLIQIRYLHPVSQFFGHVFSPKLLRFFQNCYGLAKRKNRIGFRLVSLTFDPTPQMVNVLQTYSQTGVPCNRTLRGAYSAVRAEQERLTRGVLAILTQSANLQFVIQLFAVLKLLVTNISIPRLSRKVLSVSTRLLV